MTERVALDRGSGRVDSSAVEPLVPLWRSSTVAPQRAGARTTATARARERRSGDVALARRRRAAALVPLARHARQPDRLGRHAHGVPAAGGAGRDGRGRRAAARAAPAGPVRPSLRPRRGAPLLALRARGRDARSRGRRRAADRGAAAGRGRPRRPGRSHRRRARRAGGAGRHRRPRGDRSPRRRRGAGAGLVAARARRPRRGLARRRPGTRSRRVGRSSAAARHARSEPGRPADATRVSTSRCCFPRSSAGSSPSEHRGLPAYAGEGALRGTGGRQASDAIRSSTDLNTSAPSASATIAATTR